MFLAEVIEGTITMKTLFAFVALAGMAQTAALAWMNAPTPDSGSVHAGNARSAQHLATEHLLSIAFPEPIATNRTSIVLDLDQALILIDPVGNQEQYKRFGRPDIVILTRAHPDHLSIDTMIGLLRRDTVVLATQSVIDQLPLMISNNVITPFEAGTEQVVNGITFRALSNSSDIPRGTHVYGRDRGDIGVVIEIDGVSGYF
ncbi:MBL fold metallo-hydrolase [Palleronia sp. KMU-117]|uniref:MBL fold metallo-hydrolase n=1 Tax=Palleronia sp. KMU-117 TaxID=3434108 RepID=UPI003D763D14